MDKIFYASFHVFYLLAMVVITAGKSNSNPAPTLEEKKKEKQEKLKMTQCPYWSKHDILKCAVNPSVSCLDCDTI